MDRKYSVTHFKNMIKANRVYLTPKERKKKRPKSPKMMYPLAQEKEYFLFLKKIMRRLVDITENQIIPALPNWTNIQNILTRDAYDDWTEDLDRDIDSMQEESDILFKEKKKELNHELLIYAMGFYLFHQNKYNNIVESASGIKPYTQEQWWTPLQSSWVSQNTALIKGLSDEYIKKINFTVNNGISKGIAANEIARQLKEINNNMSDARVKLIARDQTSKLYGQLTKQRANDIGADIYIWRTVKDDKVRDSHRPLEGKYCSFSNPNVYAVNIQDAINNNWSERTSDMFIGDPGEDYQCRCFAEIVLDDIINSVDNEINNNYE